MILEWFGPEVSAKQDAYYEKAYARAALEGNANGDSATTYTKMFGEAPKNGTPYWLVRLACYYGALVLGHTRTKTKMASIDKAMFSCVTLLDEKALRNRKDLWHYMYLHDVEPASFGGRELVDLIPR